MVQVVNENPDALFGKAFPSSGCAVTSRPIARLWPDQTAQLLGDWFDANPPEGSTPLVGVLDRIASSTDQYFGTYGGPLSS